MRRYVCEKYNPSTGNRDLIGVYDDLARAKRVHAKLGGRIFDAATKLIWTDNMGMWMPTMVEVTR